LAPILPRPTIPSCTTVSFRELLFAALASDCHKLLPHPDKEAKRAVEETFKVPDVSCAHCKTTIQNTSPYLDWSSSAS
jgi:hypothetical protein